jgi:hypothetical protein
MMPPERLEQITRIVEGAGLDAQTVDALREAFPYMHLTHCMDDDIGIMEPARRAARFNIYLVDGGGHCMRFTTAIGAATGMVLAELDEEQDD